MYTFFFMQKLLQASHHDINYTIPDPVATIKEMEKRANQLNFKYLTLVKLPFVIGKDFKIGVSVHFLVR